MRVWATRLRIWRGMEQRAWSMGHRVKGQRTEVGGQRLENRGQKSDAAVEAAFSRDLYG